MGFLDIFKKKKAIEEKIIEKQNISLEKLPKWIKTKQEEIKKNRKEIFTLIKKEIEQIIPDLKQGISIILNIDIKSRKIDHRIEIIMKENLNNYVHHLEKLIDELKKLDTESNDFLEKLEFIISKFQKKSNLSYQKLTYIMPKEIKETREILRKFIEKNENITKENKKTLESFKSLNFISQEIDKFSKTKKQKNGIKEEIKIEKNKIEKLKLKLINNEKEINELKKSPEYIQNQKNKEKLENEKKNLLIHIQKLKECINFKTLLNFYHKFEKEKEIIKSYKDNFQHTFNNQGEKPLLNLFDKASIDKNQLLKEIEIIDKIKNQINKIKIKSFKTTELKNNCQNIKIEITGFLGNIEIQQKRLFKLKKELENNIKNIKEKLKNENIELNL